MHSGVDLKAKMNEDVFAIADGTVIKAVKIDKDDGGLRVNIQHKNGFVTRSMHLSEVTVHVGDKVVKGQKIGEVGKSGNTPGDAHLHFETLIYGVRVNPCGIIIAERQTE